MTTFSYHNHSQNTNIRSGENGNYFKNVHYVFWPLLLYYRVCHSFPQAHEGLTGTESKIWVYRGNPDLYGTTTPECSVFRRKIKFV